jgi:hypothetical protein
MAATGSPHAAIARALSISEDTLARHFGPELTHGHEDVTAAISKGVAEMALKGDKTMAIFYLKTRAGWSERTHVGYLGADGRPVDPSQPTTYTIAIVG